MAFKCGQNQVQDDMFVLAVEKIYILMMIAINCLHVPNVKNVNLNRLKLF